MASAEIIAVGSELLTPEKTDTNSLWLTSKLNELGIQLELKSVVGDDGVRLEEAIRDAFSRSDIVITTGGLGPTEDDITRKTAAQAVGKELVFETDVYQELRAKFKSFGVEMPEKNRSQAYIIEGSEVLRNNFGTAPGIIFEQEGRYLVVLPGPPRELKPMFENEVVPRIQDLAGNLIVRRKSLRVTGFGESALDELIAPIYTEYENPVTSTLFSRTDITVQFTATAENENEAGKLLADISEKVCDKLGIHVFSEDNEDMEVVVGRMLTERGLTLGLAESCTGGLASKRLTDVPGSSKFFLESAVTYSNDAKARALGVPIGVIEEHGAVSAQVAESMACGLKEKTDVDIAVSITGIAGPSGGSKEKPVGTVFFGLADNEEIFSKKFVFPGDRNLIRWRSSQFALDLVRRQLLKKDE